MITGRCDFINKTKNSKKLFTYFNRKYWKENLAKQSFDKC